MSVDWLGADDSRRAAAVANERMFRALALIIVSAALAIVPATDWGIVDRHVAAVSVAGDKHPQLSCASGEI